MKTPEMLHILYLSFFPTNSRKWCQTVRSHNDYIKTPLSKNHEACEATIGLMQFYILFLRGPIEHGDVE